MKAQLVIALELEENVNESNAGARCTFNSNSPKPDLG
jgi:hypothetical protein